MEREPFFDLERKRIAARMANDIRGWRSYSQELGELAQQFGLLPCPADVSERISDAVLSADIIKKVLNTDGTRIHDEVRPRDFPAVRKFVENLFDVDLAAIRIYRSNPVNGEEAGAAACGERSHAVFFPKKGFMSRDLIAHEIGHTAEDTIRRQSDDLRMLISHRIVSETVAYYTQFRYLLEHGDQHKRQGALGTFLFSHLAAQIVFSTTIENDDRSSLLAAPRLTSFRQAYSDHFLIDRINSLSNLSRQEIYYSVVECRYSIPIALKLINDNSAVRRLMSADIGVPLDTNLTNMGIDSETVLDFTDLDTLLMSFIDGSILTS